jgi:hypothetical protein
VFGDLKVENNSAKLVGRGGYFAQLVTLSKNADTVRPELARATAFLAKK